MSTQPPGESYRPETPWGPWAALLATFAVMATAVAASIAAIALSGIGVDLPMSATASAVGMLVLQATAVVLTVLLAGWRGASRRAVLALRTVPAPAAFAAALGGMILLLGPLNLLILVFARETLLSDLRPFQYLILSEVGPLYALILAVGAPLSEELLFRGFLQSALAATSIGFAGATLVTTVLWTGLHAGYSWIGLLEVFIIGLYLAYVLWRTGSLWPPIVCHAAYNGLLFMLMRFHPFAL